MSLELDPLVAPLFGANPVWTPAREHDHGPREVCAVCGAIGGAPVVVALPDGTAVQTGIRAGESLVCAGCQCVSPENHARLGRGTKPRPRTKRTPGERASGRRPARRRRPPRLTARERKAVAKVHGAIGRAFLAQVDAERRGNSATADRLRALLATASTTTEAVFATELWSILAGAKHKE